MFVGQGNVPLVHIAAEIAAAPFAHELGFTHALQRLDGRAATALVDSRAATAQLWAQLEEELRRQWPGVTLDELTALRDHIWFRCEQSPVEIAELRGRYVGDLGRWLSRELHGGPMRDVHDAVRQRLVMRWMRFALPRDFFDPSGSPQLSDAMWKLLQEGYAECHLHLGGALQFDTAWASLCAQVARPAAWDAWEPGIPFGDPERFLCAATCAAIALGLIDLVQRWDSMTARQRTCSWLDARLRQAANDLGVSASSITVLWSGVAALERGRLDAVDRIQLACALCDLQVLRARSGYPPVASAIPPLGDPLLSRHGLRCAALQAERIRVMFYRYLVQRPLTRGLQHFFRHFARLRRFKGGHNLVTEAMTLCGAADRSLALGSLELRVAPEDDAGAQRAAWTALNRDIEAAQAVHRSDVDIHVVMHFVRSRGGGQRSARPAVAESDTVADPRHDLAGWRYARFHHQIVRQHLALRELLKADASARHRLRALDLCSDEAGIPTWVYAAQVTALRDDPELHALGCRLRMTVHCGEDFVDLLTGLRRVWEAVRYLKLREGDRLGHALALGMDVTLWTGSIQAVTRRSEERMWDLVWAWSLLRRSDRTSQLHAIAAEAERLGRWMFREPRSIHDLHALYKALHRREDLAATGYPDNVRDVPDGNLTALREYLQSPEVFQRGQRVKLYETARDAETIESCQKVLWEVVSRAGLAIEVNVSSNLLIGNLLQRRAHPLWRFRSPVARGSSDIGIVFGSDDPVTFATSLPEEYQLAYDLLVNDGIAPVDAFAWVNDVRRHGLSSRFAATAPRPEPRGR